MINPDYLSNSPDFERAARQELSEAAGYLGWEWWKKVPVNEAQCALEFVDTLHFLVSGTIAVAAKTALIQNKTIEEVTSDFIDILLQNNPTAEDFDEVIPAFDGPEDFLLHTIDRVQELLLNAPNACGPMLLGVIAGLGVLGYDADRLYRTYISKNTLNTFRTLNGQKAGKYTKHWEDGKEDNVFLVEITDNLVAAGKFTPVKLMSALGVAYNVKTGITAVTE